MALTLTAVANGAYVIGNKKARTYDVTFDSSYATGGESLTAANVGLKKIVQVLGTGTFTAGYGGTTGVQVAYDYTNSKLQAFWSRANDGNAQNATVAPEVTSTTDLSTQKGRLTFIGY